MRQLSVLVLALITLVAPFVRADKAQSENKASDTTSRPADGGEKYALLVGVGSYRNDSDLTGLKYSESDMTNLARSLAEIGFKPENIRLMVQTDITDPRFKSTKGNNDQYKPRKENIETELQLLLDNKRREDLIIVAFAGHGVQYRGEDETVYFCPSDARISNKDSLLPLSNVFDKLKNCAAAKKLLIADCCRSDPVETGRRAAYSSVVGSVTRLQKYKLPESMAAFYSCRGGESAFEDDDLKSGVFTHFLAKGLRGDAAQNGSIEITALAAYVRYNVYEYVRKKHSVAQTPVCQLNSDEMMVLGQVNANKLTSLTSLTKSKTGVPNQIRRYIEPPSAPAVTETLGYASGFGGKVICFDTKNGRVLSESESGKSPAYMAWHPSLKYMYAINEVADGKITASSIDPKDGKLTRLNEVSSGGKSPSHISVHPKGRWVFAAHYGDGAVSVFPILADGSLGEAVQTLATGTQAHQIICDPSGKFVFVPCIRSDYVAQYRFDESTGRLTPNDPPALFLAKGTGPRHLAFHPNGRFVYLMNELNNTVTTLTFDLVKGTLTPIQTLSAVQPSAGEKIHTWSAHIAVSNDARFVYASI